MCIPLCPGANEDGFTLPFQNPAVVLPFLYPRNLGFVQSLDSVKGKSSGIWDHLKNIQTNLCTGYISLVFSGFWVGFLFWYKCFRLR